jgi:hypothetical protein
VNSFKEYLKKKRSQDRYAISAPSSESMALSISGVLKASSFAKLSDKSAEKFSQRVSELATSEDVLDELSDDIGRPRDLETEDEFVDRAKSTFKKILNNRLSI